MTPGALSLTNPVPTGIVRERRYTDGCFVVEHVPAAATSGVVVVILGSLGYEDTCAYRPLRHLADVLAGAGHVAVRLDWPGLGDSIGGPEGDVFARAVDMVRNEVAELRERGAARVVLLGLRAGALLALAVGGPELVLWAPPAGGRAYLREERAFHRMAARAFGEVPADAPALEAGAVEAGGFLYSPETVRSLEALDAVQLAAASGAERVLVLERQGTPPVRGLAEAFGAATVRVAPGTNLADLLENPYVARLDSAVLAAVVEFCEESKRGPVLASSRPGVLELGAGVTERPWTIVGPAGELSGVLCQPEREAPADVPWTLFFNAGGIRRSGPNRLWTVAARALAAEGRPSLRFDVRDVGDSDGLVTPGSDLESMYSEESIGDAVAAHDWLVATRAAEVDVVGLCSGAFMGMQVASRRPVRRAVLFNGLAYVWNEAARANGTTSQIGRSLFDLRRWRRLLTGRIDAWVLLRALGSSARLGIGRGLAALRGLKPGDPVETLITGVMRRGTNLRMISGSGDPSIDYLLAHTTPAARPDLTVLDGVDHTFRPLWSHGRVIRWIVAGGETTLPRSEGADRPSP